MKKISQYINRLYRLSYMKEVGIVAVIGITALIIISLYLFFSPKESMKERYGAEQFLTIKTNHLVNNNPYFHHFLSNIKDNNGVLILGTSESSAYENLNYWGHLNADSSADHQFSLLYGAGRFCEMYFPFIVENPEFWREQEILVFINPTYWRKGLNNSSKEYQTRYLTEGVVYSSKDKLAELNLFDPIFGEVYNKQNKYSSPNKVDYLLDQKFRTLYSDDVHSLFVTKTPDFSPFVIDRNQQQKMTPKFIDSLKSLIDPKYNALYSFLEAGITPTLMPIIDTTSDYRYTALKGMFTLCQKYDIKVTYLIGPYNAILANEVSTQETIDTYENLLVDLRTFFKKHNQETIDLTDISYVKHSFNDAQHHSVYGGYLIYQRIKTYYEKK